MDVVVINGHRYAVNDQGMIEFSVAYVQQLHDNQDKTMKVLEDLERKLQGIMRSASEQVSMWIVAKPRIAELVNLPPDTPDEQLFDEFVRYVAACA